MAKFSKLKHYFCTLSKYFTFSCYFLACGALIMFDFYHVALSSCCTFLCYSFFHVLLLFILQSSTVQRLWYCTLPCCTSFMLHPSQVSLFSCCFFLMLNSFHVAIFASWTLFMLYFFPASLFSSWTFFMLHYSRLL